MIFSEFFKDAILDYIYFIEKDYSEKSVLKIICDRYGLSGVERTILFRGITKKYIANKRKQKIANINDLKNQTIFIDGYNVLITIASYLEGNFTFVGNDGVLRDVCESHGIIRNEDLLLKALFLIFDYLDKNKIKETYIYLDKPVSFSGILSQRINKYFNEEKINGFCETVHSPDYNLKNLTDGICSTSDSTIIDKTNTKIFDIPKNLLEFYYSPQFFSIERFINPNFDLIK